MPASPDVVDFVGARRADEFRECLHEIEAMDVVARLFAFVPEYAIRTAAHGTDHNIREKSVQLGSGMGRTGQTAAAKGNGRHPKIAPVFLNEQIGRRF